jgi:hypothetical protein
MRFLLLGTLTPAVDQALVRHGHSAVRPEAVQIDPGLPPTELLAAAHARQLDVVTDSQDVALSLFADPVKFVHTLVFLQLSGQDVEQDDAIDRLFGRYKRLVPHRLYTVTETRVKIRQLPEGRH